MSSRMTTPDMFYPHESVDIGKGARKVARTKPAKKPKYKATPEDKARRTSFRKQA